MTGTERLPQCPSWDHKRDEPFIALPGLPEFRLTPWRKEDALAAVSGRMAQCTNSLALHWLILPGGSMERSARGQVRIPASVPVSYRRCGPLSRPDY